MGTGCLIRESAWCALLAAAPMLPMCVAMTQHDVRMRVSAEYGSARCCVHVMPGEGWALIGPAILFWKNGRLTTS